MKLVIATKNQHKVREILPVLQPSGIQKVSTLNDYPDIQTIEETGTTFDENASIKARAVCNHTGLPSLADDSGLEIDALNREPGVYSARYGGPGLDDGMRNQLVLNKMSHVPDSERTGRFVCVMALAFPDGRIYTRTGTCEGLITREPRGTHGFGYDPIFYLEEKGKTMAELPLAEKNRISHRAQALHKIADLLASLPDIKI
ncbi:MAG: XTP/dITP diphosphatase [Spirochaetota bacterium]